jgi:hypothetical protein
MQVKSKFRPKAAESTPTSKDNHDDAVVVHQQLLKEVRNDTNFAVLRIVSYVKNGRPTKNSPMLEFREFYIDDKGNERPTKRLRAIPGKTLLAMFFPKSEGNVRINKKMETVLREELRKQKE